MNRNEFLINYLDRHNGLLRLKSAWVARNFLPPGKRLGLDENRYNLGERGGVCERWLASTTLADNKIKVQGEGLSYLAIEENTRISLKEAIESIPERIMGKSYSRKYSGLNRLAKIFDYKCRLPYHMHQMKHHAALVGQNPKEEAYYFPEGVDMGEEAESYLGLHPYIAREKKYDILLPYLKDWNSDLILQHSKAYKLVADDGFHIPSGTLHAPGSALTIELQEDSDVFAMLQAKVGDIMIPKDLLFKDVRKEDRKRFGEKIILEMIDWETSGDPYFYENRHTPPVLRGDFDGRGAREFWIFYNTHLFSGTKLVADPGATVTSIDKGVYSFLIWRGGGTIAGMEFSAGISDRDEALVCHDAAVSGITITNTGTVPLVMFKFFGPDINNDAPMLAAYDGR
jgi:hypothetical protein